jgi:hypothetical protein
VACAIRIVGSPCMSVHLCELLACLREIHPLRRPRERHEMLGPPRWQKVKVLWLDGEYEGLEEWIPEVRLVAPWNEADTLLEDALRMFAALEVSGDVYVTTTYKEVETVFFAIPREMGAEAFSVPQTVPVLLCIARTQTRIRMPLGSSKKAWRVSCNGRA